MATSTKITFLTTAQYTKLLTSGFTISFNRVAINELASYAGRDVLLNCDQVLFVVVNREGKVLESHHVLVLIDHADIKF